MNTLRRGLKLMFLCLAAFWLPALARGQGVPAWAPQAPVDGGPGQPDHARDAHPAGG